MNLAWGDPHLNAFVTNVGLITTNGKYGHNVMSCEWTHLISYKPALILLAIRDYKVTYEHILASRAFGVNIAAVDQNVVTAVAGNDTGKELNKILLLKDLGVTFYPAETIDVLMVTGAAMNAECRLVKTVEIGDHPLLIGEVQKITHANKEPLLYHQTKYFTLGAPIQKPDPHVLDRIEQLKQQYKKHP